MHMALQVFTSIFLAETSEPLDATSEKWDGGDFREHGLREIRKPSLQHITMLENHDWFGDNLPEN